VIETKDEKNIKRRVLAIGISKYKLNNISRRMLKPLSAAKDAIEICNTFTKNWRDINEIKCKVIEDFNKYDEIKFDDVESALDSFEKDVNNSKTDTAIIYWGGHTVYDSNNETFNLALYDTDPSQPSIRIYRARDLIEKFLGLNSHESILILDVCYAEGIAKQFIEYMNMKIDENYVWTNNNQKIILAACQKYQLAYENNVLGHGLFSQALLNTLDGKGYINKNNEVTIGMIYSYVLHNLPEISPNDQIPILLPLLIPDIHTIVLTQPPNNKNSKNRELQLKERII
jgi:uncharacterized caspase-like protein